MRIVVALAALSVGVSPILAPAFAETRQTVVNLAAKDIPATEEIAGLFDRWNRALATGKPATVAALYAKEGGVLLPTVSNQVRDNRSEIEAYFVDFLKYKPQGVINESYVRMLDANTAIDSGIYTFDLTRNGKVDKVQARYSFLYKRIDGEWMILEHHSSAMPEPVKS